MPAQYNNVVDQVRVSGPDNVPVRPATEDSLTLLRRILLLLKPLGVITGGGSSRLSVDVNNIVGGTVGTVTTVTTCTTVTTVTSVTGVQNIVAMGGIPSFDQARCLNRSAYNEGIRANLR